MNSFRLPFFTELQSARNVLIAGAGGGFDVFSGLPLYFNLRAAGRQVFLGNLTFSNLPPDSAGRHLTPYLVAVTADSEGSKYYFPEKHLSQWFRERGREVPVYTFHRTGPKRVTEAYRALVDELEIRHDRPRGRRHRQPDARRRGGAGHAGGGHDQHRGRGRAGRGQSAPEDARLPRLRHRRVPRRQPRPRAGGGVGPDPRRRPTWARSR